MSWIRIEVAAFVLLTLGSLVVKAQQPLDDKSQRYRMVVCLPSSRWRHSGLPMTLK